MRIVIRSSANSLIARLLPRGAGELLRLLALSGVAQLFAVATVLLLISDLGTERFGILSSALALQGYMLTIGSAGVKSVVVREATRRVNDYSQLSTSHLVITGMASVAVLVAVLAHTWILDTFRDEGFLLILLALGTIGASVDNRSLFDAAGRSVASVWIGVVAEALALALAWLLSDAGLLTLPVVGLVFAGKWVLAAGAHYAYFHLRVEPLSWRWSRRQTLALVRCSWPLLLSGLVVNLPLTAGVVLVRIHFGGTEAAPIGLAQQVGQAYVLFAAMSHRLLQPAIARPAGMVRGAVRSLARNAAALLILLWVAAFGLSAALIMAFLPADLRPAVPATAGVLTGSVLASAASIATLYLIALGKEAAVLQANLAAVLLYGVCAWLLVPTYSWRGAVAAAVLASLVRALLAATLVARTLRKRDAWRHAVG